MNDSSAWLLVPIRDCHRMNANPVNQRRCDDRDLRTLGKDAIGVRKCA
jgi:hypothetical protein